MRETVREQLARRGATAEDLADLDSATDALRALASAPPSAPPLPEPTPLPLLACNPDPTMRSGPCVVWGPRDEVRDPILPPFSRSGGLNADWFNALAEALGCRDVPAFTDGTAFLQQDADAILRCARRARSL